MVSSNSSNTNNLISITDLQETHYQLMKGCVNTLNYISKTNFPFKTLNYADLSINKDLFSSNPELRFISKFIDIYEIKMFYIKIKEDILSEEEIILKIFFFLVSIFIFLPYKLIDSINFFQLKFLTYIMTKLYIQNINNNLIVLYSRLKASMNSDIEEELQIKTWLTRSINDCKIFNANFSGFNSKVIIGILTFLTPALPVILRTLTSNNWIKPYLSKLTALIKALSFNIISWQFILLIVLYLPTIVILMFLIKSFKVKYFILNFFNIYSIESKIYNILNYKDVDTEQENYKFGQLLIQIFFIINAIICFVPHILDLSYQIKLPVGIISILISIVLEIPKRQK
ncbi:hypothetical protein [Nostoc sp. NMS4]|uniref:hypothetical protein n=1 Tax=Nostoc sp. NMS4 TaxID=2815390 RepID=UPI0025E41FD6|nr:hypothetical protein [Nostoc sp. NMS4]MBN3927241.1 hypothetical protein [Nostoc sp. NMS4]